MGFSKKAKIALAASALAVAVMAWAIGKNQDSPVTTPPPTQTIEDIIPPTDNTTTVPEEQCATLDWSGYNVLKYQKGEISWEGDIGIGIEESVKEMIENPDYLPNIHSSDLRIKGAFVDEKDRYVVAWGDIRDKPFGKISFRNPETGAEKSAYWLNRTDIDDLIVLYDVPTDKGIADYIVIVGDTIRTEIKDQARIDTSVTSDRLPVIEILQLTDEGPVPLTYNPIVQEKAGSSLEIVDGKLVYSRATAVRDEAGNVTLNFKLKTDTKPKGSSASVALNDILDLEYGVPILGRFMP